MNASRVCAAPLERLARSPDRSRAPDLRSAYAAAAGAGFLEHVPRAAFFKNKPAPRQR